ncbi:MAG: radical SAM family heme chaperone HemW [Planctomycetota bacterium]
MALTTASFDWPTPTAAYIHIPFCRHRCGYCNFSVVAGRDDLIDRFLLAIDQELTSLECPSVETVFLGGGTPTHLSSTQLARLLEIVRRRFDFPDAEEVEFSVEANPEDISGERLKVLRDHGVNRLSLGVQSFHPDKLKLLERSHDASIATRAIESSHDAIRNVSIDLIFAAPGETIGQWREDVQTALRTPVQHLSTYSLTFEKGTSFWNRQRHGELVAISEETEVQMYQETRRQAREHGMQHYEISNFGFAGNSCRHNLAYWQGSGWFAAGPGAARFVGGKREVNHRSPLTYLRRVESGQTPVAESETISQRQHLRERVAFGIRMLDGFEIDTLPQVDGRSAWDVCSAAIQRHLDLGTVVVIGDESDPSGRRLRLTEQGLLFADSVASDLLG